MKGSGYPMLDPEKIKELEDYIKARHKENILTEQDYYEPFTINTQKWLDEGWNFDDITEVMMDMDPMYEDYDFPENEAIRIIIVV